MFVSRKNSQRRAVGTAALYPAAGAAFTLVEVLVAVAVLGIMVSGLFGGFGMTFKGVQLDRENSRAIQILVEKTEMLRVYNWDQLTGVDASNAIPATFTAPFYPSSNNGGFQYQGTVLVTNVPLGVNYSNDMRAVTVTLNWMSGKAPRTRAMTTWVSQYGMQNYLY
jgi:prepilin-type N-terminal cleavage/methylation domain-containing protein